MKKINKILGAIALFLAVAIPSGLVFAATYGWDGTTIFDGYGSVKWSASAHTLTMTPKAATQPSETHAALAVSGRVVHQPFQLSYTMKTVKQLRTGSAPNPWEVGWVIFGYKDTGEFKYLILKPKGYGLELGESLLLNKQNFLHTSTLGQYNFPVNANYNVVLRAQKNVITVSVNGKKYLQYTMSAKDTLPVDGKYGFYTEDASVKISNIKMQQL
ncbi:MAG: hypothetical protein NT003_03645 [Candidatus Magasanikbacteria bacterium]|nr:hypothetical protein [Candidatus Magasanikbacteria bacterium]